ncbi:MAG: signal peptidase I [Phycisphaeraceae bacterium]|nr:signal peptidase I [Phycisphaeraceae bacterium]
MVGILVFLIQIAIAVVVIAGLWKMFVKAGHPGWAAIVPIYNIYILTKVAGRPWWWLLLLFIPIVSLVIAIILMLDIAKAFGKSVLFAVGLILLFPIFACILGFGSAQYQGPPAR